MKLSVRRYLVFLSSLALSLAPLAQATAQPFFTNITEAVGLDDEPVDVVKLSGSLSGSFYLDDIRLVRVNPGQITAVVEEEVGVLPRGIRPRSELPQPLQQWYRHSLCTAQG